MVAFLLLVPACDIMGPARACTLIALFSVRVVAVDQVTGEPVHEGLWGHVRDGSFQAELYQSHNRLYGVEERPGVYRVDVRATGYEPWVRHSVRVGRDECHVKPVELTAEMTPQ